METPVHRPYRVALLILPGLFALLILAFSSYLASHAQTTTATRITFQDGVSPATTYVGTTDTYIVAGSPNSTHPLEDDLQVSGGISPTISTRANTLIGWDISTIPPLSTVQAVTMTLYITETSSYSYTIFDVKKAWSESLATWNQATTGSAWLVPGAVGNSADVGTTPLASFTPTSTLTSTVPITMTFRLNSAGVSIVQSWVNTPGNNRGLIITNYNNPDGAKFVSSDFRLAKYRPKLEVKYVPADYTPTNTTAPIINFVGVAKTVSPATQVRGGYFTFRIDVTNTSNTTLIDPTLTDSFPSYLTITSVQPSTGSFSYSSGTRTVTVYFADIARNTSAYVTILAQVNTTATSNTTHTDSAKLTFLIGGTSEVFSKQSNSVTYLIQGTSTLPPTGGIEASPTASGVFLASLGICALLSLIGLAAILYSLVAGERQAAWAGWLIRMGAILVIAAAVFGVLAWASRPAPSVQAPEPVAQIAPSASPTPSVAWILQEGGYAEVIQTPTPLTLPDYPIPTPRLESTPAPGEEEPDTSAVMRIEIPAIGVSTVVKYVPYDGTTWMIGGLRQEVAWMGDTSWPGLGANTGLAGHITLGDGSDGPFRKLGDLKAGDIVNLYTEENIYTYRVRQRATVDDTDMSVLAPSDESTITLITCTNWSKDLKVYLQRLIVVANLEKVEPILQAQVVEE